MAANPVLVLDNDASSTLDYPDYAHYYTETLEAMGIAYDYYDADANFGNDPTFPDLATLQSYETIIYFTGDNFWTDGSFTVSTPPTNWDQNLLLEYLRSGGRVLATGQDMAAALGANGYNDPTGLYNYHFGAEYIQDHVFVSTTTPYSQPIMGMAGSFAANIRLDVGYGGDGDGANNQAFVDEVEVYDGQYGFDVRPVPAKPLFQADITDGLQAEGYVGLTRASDPTLEQGSMADGRSVYLSFGFEGVNDPDAGTLAGFDSRRYLMEELMTYLLSEPTATLPDTMATTGEAVTLTTTAGFVGATPLATSIVSYRWDFGDGSAFETTTTPSVNHVYAADGTYTVRVEVTDNYGHSYIAQATVTAETVVTGYSVYLPAIMKTQPTYTP
jgi:hypothetical protein